MNEIERQEFIKKETKAIYEEFNAYVGQMILLKPFLKNLADVANGANPNYELYEVVKKTKEKEGGLLATRLLNTLFLINQHLLQIP